MSPLAVQRYRVATLRCLWAVPLLLAQACTVPARLSAVVAPPPRTAPTTPTTPTAAAKAIAVTAHPLATEAALAMLRRGGSAVDAAIAAQMVLGLVEPQSSGLGGGAVALHWDAARRHLSSIDGLSAAPARSTTGLEIDNDGSTLPEDQVRRGGRSVGTPGALALFERLHQQHGKLPWATLFEPAIAHAEQGFALPPYLHSLLRGANAARDHADLVPLFFDADGRVLPIGTLVKHPAYARTLRALAELGPRGWLLAGAAREMAATAQRGAKAGWLTEADLLAYRAEEREPLCAERLKHRVCVMGPTSFGGMAVLQMLGVLEASPRNRAAATWRFDDAEFVHRFAEASRLAYADRLGYAADPGYVHVPVRQLVARPYLDQRALLLQPGRATPRFPAGELSPTPTSRLDVGPAVASHAARDEASTAPEHADDTSQLVVVDAFGNALSLTTTINLNFGSRLMVSASANGVANSMAGGIVLNNVLTNFSSAPKPGHMRSEDMRPNRMQGGKRPVTSMTPTIVFDAHGEPLIVGGSAGGAQIVEYVAQSLVQMLVHGHMPAQALASDHVAGNTEGVLLERGKPVAQLATTLRAMGHTVGVVELRSGLGFARRTTHGWVGAADPRRDGVAATLP